ncbi:MAG: SAM-dependent chlorinase/fluorinase [Bacteroidia bacterium]
MCDFGVNSPEYTVAQAQLLHLFPEHRLALSPQPMKKGHVQAQSIFLRLVKNHFPNGTIHLCHFRTQSRQPKRFVAAWNEGQLFLAPDNGLLTLLFGADFSEYYRLPVVEPFADPLTSVYLPALTQIVAQSGNLNDLFEPKDHIVSTNLLAPTLSGTTLRLTVLYNDSHGNAYLNFDRAAFDHYTRGKRFVLRSDSIHLDRVSNHYDDVVEGEAVLLFGLGDLMQVAVNAGSAQQYLALNEGKMLLLDFSEE